MNAPHAPTHAAAESDNTRTRFILIFVIATCLVLGVLVVAVDQWFGVSVQDEISRKLLQPENTQLRKLRAEEEAKLTSYQWVDQKAGVVRIPVDRALELTLRDWEKRPTGFVPGTAQPAAVPGSK